MSQVRLPQNNVPTFDDLKELEYNIWRIGQDWTKLLKSYNDGRLLQTISKSQLRLSQNTVPIFYNLKELDSEIRFFFGIYFCSYY